MMITLINIGALSPAPRGARRRAFAGGAAR